MPKSTSNIAAPSAIMGLRVGLEALSRATSRAERGHNLSSQQSVTLRAWRPERRQARKESSSNKAERRSRRRKSTSACSRALIQRDNSSQEMIAPQSRGFEPNARSSFYIAPLHCWINMSSAHEQDNGVYSSLLQLALAMLCHLTRQQAMAQRCATACHCKRLSSLGIRSG